MRVVAGFCLGRWDVSDRLKQAAVVEPVDPSESGELHRLEAAPRSAPMDHLGLEQPDDGLGQSVIVAVSDAADGRLDTRLGEALRVAK